MRLLLIHQESVFFAGAEKLLGYFLQELIQTDLDVTVAAVKESQVESLVPAGMKRLALPPNPSFSLPAFGRQVRGLLGAHRARGCDVVHGWSARDWELAAMTGLWIRRPVLGTLHDHPQARFISRKRQWLMRGAARTLRKVVCVSHAVRQACTEARYASERLAVIHNGLPIPELASRISPAPPYRLGFLGVFSERKGLPGLFAIVDELSRLTSIPWELSLAGQPQDQGGQRLVEELKARYSKHPWWPQVRWLGWVDDPLKYLAGLDLLICPSCEFEPFGLVLCEAALAGVPTLAARQGGIPEIIQDGQTGWLFTPDDAPGAARLLSRLLESPAGLPATGARAYQRIRQEFSITKMVAAYQNLYSTLIQSAVRKPAAHAG